MKVTVGTQEYAVDKNADSLDKKYVIPIKYRAHPEEDSAVVKIEKISVNMPLVYTIEVY